MWGGWDLRPTPHTWSWGLPLCPRPNHLEFNYVVAYLGGQVDVFDVFSSFLRLMKVFQGVGGTSDAPHASVFVLLQPVEIFWPTMAGNVKHTFCRTWKPAEIGVRTESNLGGGGGSPGWAGMMQLSILEIVCLSQCRSSMLVFCSVCMWRDDFVLPCRSSMLVLSCSHAFHNSQIPPFLPFVFVGPVVRSHSEIFVPLKD